MTEAIIVKKKPWRISPIWFLPLTALLLSMWLAYESYMHKGVKVTLRFTSGSGIVINKTKVMYKGIAIGKVTDVEINQESIDEVIVTIMLDKRTKPYLLTDTKFWLVKPSISLGGISGLDTLMSGNYIAIRPGIKGTPKNDFIALKDIPIDGDSSSALVIDLQAKTLGSIVPASPLFYKKIQVGKVLGTRFNKDSDNITIKVKIEDEYADLVKKQSRFYNVSGIKVSGGLAGIKVETESLASIVMGGIAFYNPQDTYLNETAEYGDRFPLFDDFELADIGIPIHLNLKNAEGLTEGASEIRYLGKKVGFIKKINMDYSTGKVSAIAYINPAAESLLKAGTQIWKIEPVLSINQITGIETLISGIYLALRPSSAQHDTKTEAQPKSVFEVLEEPPALDKSVPGLHLNLTAEQLGSLQVGSGVYLKNIKIGSVQAYHLNNSHANLVIKIFIQAKYQQLIKPSSRFYTSSGISIKGGLSGLSIKTESLSSIISGGISVYNDDSSKENAKDKAITVVNDTNFVLYDDLEKAKAGQEIILYVKDAQGIKEAMTRIIYKGVDLGYVNQIIPDKKIQSIKLLLKVNSKANALLKKNTQFWIVKPELSLSGVSGLDSLVGGNYITLKPGGGKFSNSFYGLASAPVITETNGLFVSVKAPELGSINVGSPVLYHQLSVGKVSSYQLDKTGNNIIINLYINKKYKHLVNKKSRFYQGSGISIKGNLSGLDIRTESIAAIIKGGIAFFNPATSNLNSNSKLSRLKKSTKPNSKQLFNLFADKQSAEKNQFSISVAFPNANGLVTGTKVKFNGLQVGEVKQLSLHTDLQQVIVELLIDNKIRKILGKNSRFTIAKAEFGLAKTKNLDTLMAGSYILVEPVSGQLSNYFEAQEMKSNKGLKLVLESAQLGSISVNSPVYYRQIQVGKVVNYHLSNTADKVLITILINAKYAPLVRKNSKFWNASGINMDINLFAGSKIKTESLQSIVDGGISFATPDTTSKRDSQENINSEFTENSTKVLAKKASSGYTFTLHKEVEQHWLEWNPKIKLMGD